MEQEGLRVLSLTTDLEGAEVLVPGPLGGVRRRFSPELELVQSSALTSFRGDARAGAHAEPVEGLSTVSSASVAKGQARQLLLELLLFCGVARPRQSVRQLEEVVSFGVVDLETRFNQFGDDAAGTRPLRPGERSDPAGHARGEVYALSQRSC